MKRVDHTGEVFTRLVAEKSRSIRGRVHWLCLCSCGQYTSVSSSNLVGRHVRSCGCLSLELLAERRPAFSWKVIRKMCAAHTAETREKMSQAKMRKRELLSRLQRRRWRNPDFRDKVVGSGRRKYPIFSLEARERMHTRAKIFWANLTPTDRREFIEKRAFLQRAANKRWREERMEVAWRIEEEMVIKRKARSDRIDRAKAITRLRSSWLIGETPPPMWPQNKPMPKENPRFDLGSR